jgi:hypothetical protein
MTVYRQIKHIINLINQSHKEILLILFLINGLGILYFKNIEKKYYTDIIITAMPNVSNIQSVDIYSIFESYFRDVANFEQWKNLDTNKNQEVLIENRDIEGYQINDSQLDTNNKLVFRNAVTLQRSIYLTLPAENPVYIKNVFMYAQFIEKKLNSLDFSTKDKNMSQELRLMLERLNINYNVDLKLDLSKDENLMSFLKILKEEGASLNQESTKSKINLLPFVKVSPPKLIYTNSISINKVLFSSILISLLLVCLLLFYKDFKKFSRN